MSANTLNKIIRVFPRRNAMTPIDGTTEPPGLFREPADEVHISVAFTWDIPAAEELKRQWEAHYPVVKIGGPAYGDPGGEFVPGRYVRDGVVFTSRGCPRRCDFCLVPKREGKIRELEIKEGYVVQDNNLLACSDAHIDRVFQMLGKQKKAAEFAGGLDPNRITRKTAEKLRGLRISQMFIGFDEWTDRNAFDRAMDLLKDFPRDKKRVFVLIGRDGIDQDQARLEYAYNAGGLPFAQLFQPDDRRIEYSKEYRDLSRVWSRPAITKANMKGRVKV